MMEWEENDHARKQIEKASKKEKESFLSGYTDKFKLIIPIFIT